MSIVQPDFSKIFASGAAIGELLNWPDENYLRGVGVFEGVRTTADGIFQCFGQFI